MNNSANPPRCECHECTQARWKTSLQGQMSGALQGVGGLQGIAGSHQKYEEAQKASMQQQAAAQKYSQV